MDKVHGMAEHWKASAYEGRQTEFCPYERGVCAELASHGCAEEGIVIRENGANVFKEVGALLVFQVTIPVSDPFYPRSV